MPEKEELESAPGQERGPQELWAAGQQGPGLGMGPQRGQGIWPRPGQAVPTSQGAGAGLGIQVQG